MDPVVLAEKLEALRRCLARIESRRAQSAAALQQDADRQDIIALNLTRAVQLCVDMAMHVLVDTEQPAPRTMAESFEGLRAEGLIPADLAERMRRAVGFRNVAVHSYQAIDWAIVHTITHEGIDDFEAFARALAEHLDDRA